MMRNETDYCSNASIGILPSWWAFRKATSAFVMSYPVSSRHLKYKIQNRKAILGNTYVCQNINYFPKLLFKIPPFIEPSIEEP